jgi:uncharacterized protein YkwD
MLKLIRMPRLLPGVLAVALLVLGLQVSQGSTPVYALTNCTVSDLTFDTQEREFLRLINEYRAANSKGALTASVNLNRAASWHVVDMGTKNYFSHTDSLGRSPSTRSAQCDGPSSVGENIAAGSVRDTAQKVFDAWKASSGHNANMLNGNYKQIGIARYYNASATYGWYWSTNFSTTNDGTNLGGSTSATATPTRTTTTSATPTRTPAPTATPSTTTTKAQITSPTPGSTLPGSTVTFRWSSATGAQEYFLYVGTSQGANNIYGASQGLNLSRSVSNIPRNGSTIYVRIWTRTSSGWAYNDYTFRAASQ